jgi:Zn-dependent alcohol dehydrogenase
MCTNDHPADCEEFGPLNFGGRRSSGSPITATDAKTGDEISGRWFGQSAFARHAIVAGRSVRATDGRPYQAKAPWRLLTCMTDSVLKSQGCRGTILLCSPRSDVASRLGPVSLRARGEKKEI